MHRPAISRRHSTAGPACEVLERVVSIAVTVWVTVTICPVLFVVVVLLVAWLGVSLDTRHGVLGTYHRCSTHSLL
jgi:UPF0716 family protein affecting phage T7 exclusion